MDITNRNIVMVTGASSGIGADLARVFAAHNHDLALVARDTNRLNQLADEIAATGRPRPLVFTQDLAKIGAADELLAQLVASGASLAILVNNAGFGFSGEIAKVGRAEQMSTIDVNVRALTDLTLACLPSLIAAKGKILNVASTAAFLPGPGLAIYYATKAFVLSLSEAMSQELVGQGVQITALCPGPTHTEFQSRAKFDAELPLNKLTMMTSLSVAQIGYSGLMAGRRVVIPGLSNQIMAFASTITPHAITLPLIAWLQGIKRVRA